MEGDDLRRSPIHFGRDLHRWIATRRSPRYLQVVADGAGAGVTLSIADLSEELDINLLKVSDPKTLGTWAGLCKIDREGNPRKVVGCSCVVVRDYGEDSEGLNVLLEYFKSQRA